MKVIRDSLIPVPGGLVGRGIPSDLLLIMKVCTDFSSWSTPYLTAETETKTKTKTNSSTASASASASGIRYRRKGQPTAFMRIIQKSELMRA